MITIGPVPADDELLDILNRALTGDRAALRALVERLSPVVQARAARTLARRGGAVRRDPRQELLDMVQEVFIALLENDARALRAWKAGGGLSLENWVGLCADRQVVSILRTGKRSPWKDEPLEDAALEARAGAEETTVALIVSRGLLRQLLDRLRDELSPRMLHLFYALWVDEMPVPQLCEELRMQPDAVYAARSRIMKRAREIADELGGGASDQGLPQRTFGGRP